MYMYRDRVFTEAPIADTAAACSTIDAEILEISDPAEALDARGFPLVCHRCRDEEEPVVAMVVVYREPVQRFVLCGLCYREMCDLALGEVN